MRGIFARNIHQAGRGTFEIAKRGIFARNIRKVRGGKFAIVMKVYSQGISAK